MVKVIDPEITKNNRWLLDNIDLMSILKVLLKIDIKSILIKASKHENERDVVTEIF